MALGGHDGECRELTRLECTPQPRPSLDHNMNASADEVPHRLAGAARCVREHRDRRLGGLDQELGGQEGQRPGRVCADDDLVRLPAGQRDQIGQVGDAELGRGRDDHSLIAE